MKRYRDEPVARGWLIDDAAPRAMATASSRTRYAISAPSIDTQARLLSGGNLQRLILAREIDARADAARRRPAHTRPGRRRDRDASTGCCSSGARRGAAILLISEELDELLALADRVA